MLLRPDAGKKIDLILISPACFHELAGEKGIEDKLFLHDHVYHTFIGTPILIDRGVDTWEIREMKDENKHMDIDFLKRTRRDGWKTMSLTELLGRDIAIKEDELNFNSQHEFKRVQRILINIDTFNELASECRRHVDLQIPEDGNITFRGVSVARTPDVKQWELWG